MSLRTQLAISCKMELTYAHSLFIDEAAVMRGRRRTTEQAIEVTQRGGGTAPLPLDEKGRKEAASNVPCTVCMYCTSVYMRYVAEKGNSISLVTTVVTM